MERGFKKMIENKNKISIDEETRKENLLINTTSVQSGLREVNSNWCWINCETINRTELTQNWMSTHEKKGAEKKDVNVYELQVMGKMKCKNRKLMESN